jgi:HK97 family phage portal protein
MRLELQLFGRKVELQTKALQLRPLSQSGNGWFPWGIIRESFTGAWQSNVELRAEQVLTNPTLFAVVTLIATDVAKLCLRLVEQDEADVWTPIDSPAFSPVLRRPNRYQHVTEFVEQWMISKLTQGNTYVLLQRDQRRVVRAMYVLDPSRVTPKVTPSGDLYYELRRDDLSEIAAETVTVPASEIIHDRMVCLFHPLIGVTPIYACGAAANQGLTIQNNSTKFFANGSTPGGVLTAPGAISDETAARLKAHWDTAYGGDNYGKIAVLGDGLHYEGTRQTAVDSQLIEQMKWGDERICSTYHVPAYMVGVGPPPPYANVEPLLQAYYSQCIQGHLNKFEKCLDRGLGVDEKIEGKQYGTEFDIDDLIWMDTATRSTASQIGISSGALSPNEARKKYHGVGPVQGGDTPYMQNQMWPLKQLSERETPAAPALPAMPTVTPKPVEDDDAKQLAAACSAVRRKSQGRWRRAA